MHVRIGQLGHQRAMRVSWIANVNLRLIALAHERPSPAVVLEQGHREVIHADEAPFDSGAGTRRDRHRDRSFGVAATSARTATTTTTARDPEVLQLARIGDPSRKPFQVAARRMATTACRSEVRLSSRRRADEYLLRATVSDSGGRPWRPACASTLCRNSAIALMSSSGSAKGGIGGPPPEDSDVRP